MMLVNVCVTCPQKNPRTFCRSMGRNSDLCCSNGRSFARFARPPWAMELGVSAVQPVGENRRVGASFREVVRSEREGVDDRYWWCVPISMQPVKRSDATAEALGRSCVGFSTKVYAAVDALRNPLKLSLRPGQHADIDIVDPEALIASILWHRLKSTMRR